MLSRFLAERYGKGYYAQKQKIYWKYVCKYIILKGKVTGTGCRILQKGWTHEEDKHHFDFNSDA